MLLTLLLAASAALLTPASALVPRHDPLADPDRAPVANLVEAFRRAEPANQPYGYTPQVDACPAIRPTIRAASTLSSEESTWLKTRRPNTIAAMRTLLARLNITGLDTTTYINAHASNYSALPNVAIAASGGGYRALLNGAGGLAAFDDRITNSTAAGQLGGLLQSATYLSGLSGGSWLVGSLFANNFTSVQSIIDGNTKLWDFTNSIIQGPDQGLTAIVKTPEYYDSLYKDASGKAAAGFNTTLTDFWGRALSYQLINADDGGPAYTMSSIVNQTYFNNGSVPLPIIIADSRAPNQVLISGNTTIFEFNPFEMGSWDSAVYGFAPLQYVGSNFSGGVIPTGEDCVVGYDNIGYIYGTSSTLFNQIVLNFNTTVTDLPGFLVDAIQGLLNDFGKDNLDIAEWVNPFYQYRAGTNPNAISRQLTLVDGGEDNENIPLHPLIQPVRAVDVIFAIDSSADTETFWPNGSSLVATYQRSLNATTQNHTTFPSIPDTNTFVNLGLNTRPTFFGCNASNSTGYAAGGPVSPLIVYIPNAPYTYHSNVSTYDLSYTDAERNEIIMNGYNAATRGNASVDKWDTCVGCAILRRSLERTGTAFPAVCTTCFTDYCWNGTLNSTPPALYEPTYLLSNATVAAAAASAAPSDLRLASEKLTTLALCAALMAAWLTL